MYNMQIRYHGVQSELKTIPEKLAQTMFALMHYKAELVVEKNEEVRKALEIKEAECANRLDAEIAKGKTAEGEVIENNLHVDVEQLEKPDKVATLGFGQRLWSYHFPVECFGGQLKEPFFYMVNRTNYYLQQGRPQNLLLAIPAVVLATADESSLLSTIEGKINSIYPVPGSVLLIVLYTGSEEMREQEKSPRVAEMIYKISDTYDTFLLECELKDFDVLQLTYKLAEVETNRLLQKEMQAEDSPNSKFSHPQ